MVSEHWDTNLDRGILSWFGELNRSLRRYLEETDSVETLHQLRLSARRLESILILCKKCFRRKHRRWMLDQIKTLRSLSNPIRDCDVYAHWLRQKSTKRRLLRSTHKKRQHAAARLSVYVERLEKEQKWRRWEERALRQGGRPKLWLTTGLLGTLSDFLNAFHACPWNQAKLHRWRIRGKRLRYQLEFIHTLFENGVKLVEVKQRSSTEGTMSLFAVIDLLSELQRILGDQCDHANRASQSQGEESRIHSQAVLAWESNEARVREISVAVLQLSVEILALPS